MGIPWEAIEAWLADLEPHEAAVAFAVAGLVTTDHPEGFALPTDDSFARWRFDQRWLSGPAARAVETPGVDALRVARGDLPVYLGGPPFLRVAVESKADFPRVSERLLAVPRVDSVVQSASRPSGAPRQRAWNWPLRIGLLGVEAASDDVAEAVLQLGLGLTPQQVQVFDVLAQPSFCDVLLFVGDTPSAAMAEAVRLCRRRRLRANAVVVLHGGRTNPGETLTSERQLAGTPRRADETKLEDGIPQTLGTEATAPRRLVTNLTALRQATGATSAALVERKEDIVLEQAMWGSPLADASPADQAVAWLVGRLLLHTAHGYPWDAALTAAGDRLVWLSGELGPLAESDIKTISRAMATSLRSEAEAVAAALEAPDHHRDSGDRDSGDRDSGDRDSGDRESGDREGFAMAEPPDREALASVVQSMSQVGDIIDSGTFVRETAEGAMLPPEFSSAKRVLDAATSPRRLLCEVNRDPDGEEGNSGALVVGKNSVEVSIGMPRRGAMSTPGFDYEALFDADQRKVRLTIIFVPQKPGAEATTKNIMLPRVGDTRRAEFEWDIPAEATSVEARIMVVHRNRLLQTAVLTGVVGEPASLTDVTLVRPDLNGLDDRRAFDVTLFVEGEQGEESLIARGQSATNVVRNEVGDLTDVQAIAARMRALLDEESFAAGKRRKPNPEAMRSLLVALAQEGRHLHLRLLGLVDGLADSEYLQLVTATPGWFVPLEFIYPHEPPDDDAGICPDWLPGGDGTCDGDCIVDDDTTLVCPGAFWGMSRVIERHYRGPRLAGGVSSKDKVDSLTSGEPSAARRRLQLDHPAAAASKRVSPTDFQSLAEELGDDAELCADWDGWVDALESQPRHLLALLPHTEKGTLEINGDVEKSAKFASKRYLTGGHEVQPVVLLLGCHTAGSAEDPAGYASDALIHGAAIVVTSLSLLLNRHAAEFARRLVEALGSTSRKARPVATVMRQFRREAVFAGYPTALAITAYGDSDWAV